MAEYFDVGQFRQRNDKWRFQKLGSAKQNDKGGWDIYLDCLPLQDQPGSCRMSIVPQRERAEGGNTNTRVNDNDPSIPF